MEKDKKATAHSDGMWYVEEVEARLEACASGVCILEDCLGRCPSPIPLYPFSG